MNHYAALINSTAQCNYISTTDLTSSQTYQLFYFNNDTSPSLRLNYSNGQICPSNNSEYLTLSIDIVCDKTAN